MTRYDSEYKLTEVLCDLNEIEYRFRNITTTNKARRHLDLRGLQKKVEQLIRRLQRDPVIHRLLMMDMKSAETKDFLTRLQKVSDDINMEIAETMKDFLIAVDEKQLRVRSTKQMFLTV